MGRAVERFIAYGHPEVLGTHQTTFEITAEDHLTAAGNCIIAVSAEKGASDLSSAFREIMMTPGSFLETELICDDIRVIICGSGSTSMTLDHPTDLVWRRSSFTCGRTIGICADHTAATLPRNLITHLRKGSVIEVILTASTGYPPGQS
ncbi:MAG TPA: DUF371 domain-containing protein [Methanospirillum sp.]|nr:DUF371 domain-containing protein [Methanospirillum sp.]